RPPRTPPQPPCAPASLIRATPRTSQSTLSLSRCVGLGSSWAGPIHSSPGTASPRPGRYRSPLRAPSPSASHRLTRRSRRPMTPSTTHWSGVTVTTLRDSSFRLASPPCTAPPPSTCPPYSGPPSPLHHSGSDLSLSFSPTPTPFWMRSRPPVRPTPLSSPSTRAELASSPSTPLPLLSASAPSYMFTSFTAHSLSISDWQWVACITTPNTGVGPHRVTVTARKSSHPHTHRPV